MTLSQFPSKKHYTAFVTGRFRLTIFLFLIYNHITMAKSVRASVSKRNRAALRKKVFGPVVDARTERLAAKLQEIASQPKPKAPEKTTMDLEADETGMFAQPPCFFARIFFLTCWVLPLQPVKTKMLKRPLLPTRVSSPSDITQYFTILV